MDDRCLTTTAFPFVVVYLFFFHQMSMRAPICRGDTPFCSEECRQQQIEVDRAKHRRKKRAAAHALSTRSKENWHHHHHHHPQHHHHHQQPPRCQAEGCKADLSAAKHYHRRHKVCEYHAKAAAVAAAGKQQRFCQQCSRYAVPPRADRSGGPVK